MCDRDVTCKDVNWVEQAQGCGVWQGLVLAVLNLWFLLLELVKAYKLQWIGLLSTEKQQHIDCLISGEWCLQQGTSVLRDLLSGAEDCEVNQSQNMLGSDRSFGRLPHLSSHPTSFACSQCGKIYTRNDSLRRHLQYECGKPAQFQCPFCPKRTHQRYNLVRHIASWHKCREVLSFSDMKFSQH